MNTNYFGAYYKVEGIFNAEGDYRDKQPILHGAPRLHYIKCTDDIYYIRLVKDDIYDPKGEFICDVTVWTADEQEMVLNFLNGSDDLSVFHPVTQQIIQYDLSLGIDRETIIDTRAGIMLSSFLGFVPSHVFMIYPELQNPTIINIDGEDIEIPKFNNGSWYLLDNPEFL